MANGNGRTEPDPPQQMELVTPSPEALPPVVPPQTTTPFQVNQQFNVQQIPTKVWDKLSPDQIFELSKAVLAQVDKIDERHFEHAKEQIKSQIASDARHTWIGGLLALVGLAATTYLATHGQPVIAAVIGTFLATIIAVVVGRRNSE